MWVRMPRMSVEGRPLWKWIATYVFLVVLANFVYAGIWIGAYTMWASTPIMSDPDFLKDVAELVGEEGGATSDADWLSNFPEDKYAEFEALFMKRLETINWLPIHLFVNMASLAVVGCIAGVLMLVRYNFIILLGLAPFTLLVLGSRYFMVNTKLLTIFLGLSAELISVYAFSFATASLRRRLSGRRLAAHKPAI